MANENEPSSGKNTSNEEGNVTELLGTTTEVLARSRRVRVVGHVSEEERLRRQIENETEIRKEMAAIAGLNVSDNDVDDILEDYRVSGNSGHANTILDNRSEEEEDSELDSESDGDWRLEVWHCVNCTSGNGPTWDNCQMCGEKKETDILENGCLAPHPSSESAEEGQLGRGSQCHAGRTAVGFDPDMLLHKEEHRRSPHPERPDRLRAIVSTLRVAGLYPGRCVPLPSREITTPELLAVHTEDHVRQVDETSDTPTHFTLDTYTNQHSAKAARLASAVSVDLAEKIVRGEFRNGVALVRPPGHHAESEAIMGFCLHNNAAVAARAAQRAGARKILILDWDVHHGNGTQQIFESDPSVLYVSLHRHDGGSFYPGTGAATDVGVGPGAGYSVNIPWPSGGIGDSDYISAFFAVILPIAFAFSPDLTIISAGFDAARGDPLGGCDVTPEGYAQMTSLLSPLSNGKVLVVLEGGYNLRSISTSIASVVKVLLGDPTPRLTEPFAPTSMGKFAISEATRALRDHWPELMTNSVLPNEVNILDLLRSQGMDLQASGSNPSPNKIKVEEVTIEEEVKVNKSGEVKIEEVSKVGVEDFGQGENSLKGVKSEKEETSRTSNVGLKRSHSLPEESELDGDRIKKRSKTVGPVWWLSGRKHLLYNIWMHKCVGSYFR